MAIIPVSDGRLVRQTLRGKSGVFDTLVQRHLPSVFATALSRTGNLADADDVVQDAFIRAYDKLDTLKDPAKFGGWVSTIARNRAGKLTAEKRRRADAHQDMAANAPANASPAMDARELQALLVSKMQDLDEPHREVLLLHYFAGHSTREIAKLLETTQTAVLKRLQRAREALGFQVVRELSATQADREVWQTQSARIAKGVAAVGAGWQLSGTAAAAGTIGAGTLVGVKTIAAGVVVFAGATTAWVSTVSSDDEGEQELALAVPQATTTEPDVVDVEPGSAKTSRDIVVQEAVATPSETAASESRLASESTKATPISLYDRDGTTWLGRLKSNEDSMDFRFKLVFSGSQFQFVNEGSRPYEFYFEGTASGTHVSMSCLQNPGSDFPIENRGEFTGEFDAAFETLTTKGTFSVPGVEPMDMTVTFERVKDTMISLDLQIKIFRDEAQELREAIRSYVSRKEAMPKELVDLVTESLVEADAIAASDTRTIRYIQSDEITSIYTHRLDVPKPVWDFREDPNYPVPDQLLDYEKAARKWLIGVPPSHRMLTIEHSDVDVTFDVDFYGGVRQRLEFPDNPAEKERQQLQLRASCANNMKQLGLSLKMFQNEFQNNYLPGGWAMIYPEYVVDWNVMVCPSQPYGKLSYDLLYPASLEDYAKDLYEMVTGQSAEGVYTGGVVPIVIETHMCSESEIRNVLFYDGHVEYVTDEDWEERMGPWLAHRYE